MTIFTLSSVGVPIAFGSTQYFTAMQNVAQVKSFVDDLVMKLGTVSMRVALVLRSAEVQPVFQDLCIWKLSGNQVAIYPPFPLRRVHSTVAKSHGVVRAIARRLDRRVAVVKVLQRKVTSGLLTHTTTNRARIVNTVKEAVIKASKCWHAGKGIISLVSVQALSAAGMRVRGLFPLSVCKHSVQQEQKRLSAGVRVRGLFPLPVCKHSVQQ